MGTKQTKSEYSYRIGFLAPGIAADYQINIWQGALKVALKEGAKIHWYAGGLLDVHPHRISASANAIYELVQYDRVDALLILAGTMTMASGSEAMKELVDKLPQVPRVFIGSSYPGETCFDVDNWGGMAQLADHILSVHKSKRILVVEGFPNHRDSVRRKDALLQWLGPLDAPGAPKVDFVAADFREEIAFRLIDDVVRNKGWDYDTVICFNDNMAMGTIKALAKNDILVPSRTAVTGFDDIELAWNSIPPLTTAYQPMEELASVAVKALLAALKGEGKLDPTTTVMPTSLRIRGSCGCFYQDPFTSLRLTIEEKRSNERREQNNRYLRDYSKRLLSALDRKSITSILFEACTTLPLDFAGLFLFDDAWDVGGATPKYGNFAIHWRKEFHLDRNDSIENCSLENYFSHLDEQALVTLMLQFEDTSFGIFSFAFSNADAATLESLATIVSSALKGSSLIESQKMYSHTLEREVKVRTRALQEAFDRLSRSEDNFRQIVLGIPVPCAIVEFPGSNALYYNKPFAELIRFQSEQTQKLDFLFDRSSAPVDAVMKKARENPIEVNLLDAQGQSFRALLWTKEMTFEGKSALMLTLIDLTEKRRLERDVLEISSLEQIRIGQDLHDDICQRMAALSLQCALLGNALATGTKEQRALAAISDDMAALIHRTKNLARGLYPVELEENGLVEALREFVTRLSVHTEASVRFEAKGFDRPIPLGRDEKLHLYRIVQESVQNALKHANAKTIDIRLSAAREGSVLTVEVQDDGTGIPDKHLSNLGLGTRIMRYRAAQLGADFHIERAHPKGTLVRCFFQIESRSISPGVFS